MRIAIFGNLYQAEKSIQAKHLFNALSKYNAEILICEEFYRFLHTVMKIEPQYSKLITDNNFSADMALSLGGDGTFLKTAERVGNKHIPILGINTGRLGFLADVAENEIDEAVAELFNGDYRIEERSLLQLKADALPVKFWPFALNEAAILKRDSSSMITIRTYLNNVFLNTYQADGLIVSTPTGSTGYSLSVGGPILVPQAPNFVIAPVAPHSLNVRPLVFNDQDTIRMQIESRSNNFLLSLDGRSAMMGTNHELIICKAPFTTPIVKRNNHVFIDTLRDKLMWGADKRYNI